MDRVAVALGHSQLHLRAHRADCERKRQEDERRQAQEEAARLIEEDDEETKLVKTLAYSHQREWYQPHKKCFQHRGRQLYVMFYHHLVTTIVQPDVLFFFPPLGRI